MNNLNNRKFEVIQGGREGKETVRGDRRNLTLLRGAQVSTREVVSPEIMEATIKEGRIFLKEEIFDLIRQIAEVEGFKEDTLEVDHEVYDPKGNLVILNVRVKTGRAKGAGYGRIQFNYVIKGDLGDRVSNKATTIARIYAPLNKPDEFLAGGIVGRYDDGGWQVTPHHISDTART